MYISYRKNHRYFFR